MKKFAGFLTIAVCGFAFSKGTHDSAHPRNVADLSVGDTALGDLILLNGGQFPENGEQIRKLLDSSCGESKSFIAPFSGAPKYTDLDESRKVYLSPTRDLGIGLIKREDGSFDVEFASRNKANAEQTDFGIIEGMGTPEARPIFADRNDCISCHKAGTLLGYGVPWLNTLMRQSPEETVAGTDLHRVAFDLNLHRAYLRNLAKKDKRFKPLSEKLDGLLLPAKRSNLSEESAAEKEVAALYTRKDLPRVEGANIFANAREIEEAVADYNVVSFLHEAIKSMSDSEAKKTVKFFTASVCGTPMSDRVGEAISTMLTTNAIGLISTKPFLLGTLERPHLSPFPADKLFTDENAILKLNADKKLNRLRNTHPDHSPLNGQMFGEQANAVDGTLSYTGISFQNKVKAYVQSLCLEPSVLAGFCQSEEFRNLASRTVLPTRYDFGAAIREWRTGGSPKVGVRKACMDCHGKGQKYSEFPFDVSSIEEWKKALAAPENSLELVDLAHKTAGSLKNHKMPPPPYRSHLSDAQSKLLQQYLEGFVEIQRTKPGK